MVFSVTDFNRFTDCQCLKYTKQAVVVCPYLTSIDLWNVSFVKFRYHNSTNNIAHVISLFRTWVFCDYASVSVPLSELFTICFSFKFNLTLQCIICFDKSIDHIERRSIIFGLLHPAGDMVIGNTWLTLPFQPNVLWPTL